MIKLYYENEWVKLYHGDCLEIMPQLDIKFDCCITDLPYGTTSCKWDSVIPFEPMWNELKRLVKDNGAICLFGNEPFSSYLRISNIKMFKYDWIWLKSKSGSAFTAKYKPVNKHETIMVFGKQTLNYYPQCIEGKAYQRHHKLLPKHEKNNHCIGINNKKIETVNTGFRYPITVQYFQQNWRRQDQLHPTQKPVELMEYLIKTYTLENEYVLDFTAGSGTAGVACMNLNRKCILIEKEEKYCDIIIKRLQDKEKEISERIF